MDPKSFSELGIIDFRAKVRDFIEKEVFPNSLKWEVERHFPTGLLKTLGENNFLGLSIPEESFGQGKSLWYEVVLIEEIIKSRSLGWALSIMVQTNMLAPIISDLGTDDQIRRILKPALEGEFYLALGITEKGCGSDVINLNSKIDKGSEGLVLNGTKKYITNGSVARYILALVDDVDETNSLTKSFVLLDTKKPGIKTKRLSSIGFKSGDTAEIIFDNYIISEEDFLGKRGKGFFYLLNAVERERIFGAIALNELGRFVLDETIKEVKSKKRLSAGLNEKQSIRHKLSEFSSKLEASRQLAYGVIENKIEKNSVSKEVIMSKIYTYELVKEIIEYCHHLFGAEAFLEDHWMSHILGDSQAFTLAAGSSEIMREVLSKMLDI